MPYGFAILRVTKLKAAGGVSAMAHHNTRERPCDHADPEKRHLNTLYGGESGDKVLAFFRSRIAKDENPRKNAVVALDYMIHASPKAISTQDREKYLRAAYEWVVKRHGRENIIQAAIHRDENTEAHLHVLVVPLRVCDNQTKNRGRLKLNASHWVNGRKKLAAMQTEFAQEVGSRFGLHRGIEGSTAKHQAVQRFYGLASQEYRPPTIAVSKPPRIGDLDAWCEKESERITRSISRNFEIARAQSAYALATKQSVDASDYYKKCMGSTKDELAEMMKEMAALVRTIMGMEGPEDLKNWQVKHGKGLKNKLGLDRGW